MLETTRAPGSLVGVGDQCVLHITAYPDAKFSQVHETMTRVRSGRRMRLLKSRILVEPELYAPLTVATNIDKR